MRAQGIEANATPRVVRGQTKRAEKDALYRTRRSGNSYALREQLDIVVQELRENNSISDPSRSQLLETRKIVIAGWNAIAAKLEAQREIELGGDVRYFANHLPALLTDRERLAAQLIQFAKAKSAEKTRKDDRVRDRTLERTR